MRNGHIRHYRKEMDSYIWSLKPEFYKVWQTILLSVNWKENEMDFGGEIRTIDPGQMVTGQKHLAELASGQEEGSEITRQNVRTALQKFEKAGMVTTESTNKGTLLTVCNWGKYQQTPEGGNQQTNQQVTSKQPAANQQVTTNEEGTRREKRYKKEVQEIFDYFTEKDRLTSHRKVEPFKPTLRARFKEGWTVEEMKRTIDNYLDLLEVMDEDESNVFGIHRNWSLGELFKRSQGEKANQILQDPEYFLSDSQSDGYEDVEIEEFGHLDAESAERQAQKMKEQYG